MNSNVYQPPSSGPEGQSPPPHYPSASGGKRFANYLIDSIVSYALVLMLAFGVGFIDGGEFFETETGKTLFIVGFYVLYFGYPGIMEALCGRTVGKFCTRTQVVNYQNKEASLGQILGRTLCRLIPFDAFSFLGDAASGWHDTIPKTKVVDNSKPPLTPNNFASKAIDSGAGVPMAKTQPKPSALSQPES